MCKPAKMSAPDCSYLVLKNCMSVDPQIEKQHQALKAQSMRYAQKVSPLLVMSGLLQEALGLNQQLVTHADELLVQESILQCCQMLPPPAA